MPLTSMWSFMTQQIASRGPCHLKEEARPDPQIVFLVARLQRHSLRV